MASWSLFIALFASWLTASSGYKDGAAVSTCGSMYPSHGSAARTSGNPYVIQASSSQWVGNGSPLTVSINGGSQVFRGFLLQGRDASQNVIGTWSSSVPASTKRMQCSAAGDSVTQSRTLGATQMSFAWNPPTSGSGSVTFYATVVKSENVFWVKVASTVQTGTTVTLPPPGVVITGNSTHNMTDIDSDEEDDEEDDEEEEDHEEDGTKMSLIMTALMSSTPSEVDSTDEDDVEMTSDTTGHLSSTLSVVESTNEDDTEDNAETTSKMTEQLSSTSQLVDSTTKDVQTTSKAVTAGKTENLPSTQSSVGSTKQEVQTTKKAVIVGGQVGGAACAKTSLTAIMISLITAAFYRLE